MEDYEIYELLSQAVGDRGFCHDDLELIYDEETGEYVLWHDKYMDVAYYNPLTNEIHF